ncbi:MAG: hypothetical protein Q8M99_11850 [Methylotenera sp.]|nr:hypothetical protein [Methylotenera sp.]
MIVEIVEALKIRTNATFVGRIAGAAEFAVLSPDAKLSLPCAYVIPLDDQAQPNNSDNGYSQIVRDGFAVIVVLSNEADELGKSSIAQVIPVRNVLNAALLSWAPDSEHGPIEYDGGQLLDVDRARLYYQFEYASETQITESDTYQAIVNAALPAFTGLHLDVDMTAPFDPNRVVVGATGPDGTIDASIVLAIPQ